MYTIAFLSLLVGAVSAGFIGSPLYGHADLAFGAAPAVVAAAPAVAAVHATPALAVAPAATSYANTHRVVGPSVPIVRTVAAVHAAPVVAAVHTAPAVVAAAPALAAAPVFSYGHGFGHY